MKRDVKVFAHGSLSIIEGIGLLIVTIATLVATGQEVMIMINAGKVTLADILLLFIYLEIFAMIGIYLKAHRLPVRLPIYIAMVALARYLILDMKAMDNWRMLAVAGAIFLLAATVLLHRYGHTKFPYLEESTSKRPGEG
ncbi:MAG: phosphate-starvation-inducible PsiE family protein [Pseudomonadota bacterium]